MRFLLGVVCGVFLLWGVVRLRPAEHLPVSVVERVAPTSSSEISYDVSDDGPTGLGARRASVDSNDTIESLKPDNSAEYTIESHRGPDGYRVDRATFDHDEIALRIYKYRSEAAFRKAIRGAGEDPKDTLGVSYFDPDTNECIILVRDPAYRYQPITLGHELTHCIYGDFHKDDYPAD